MMIILVGASGSGKSTYAKNYADFQVCSADHFMMVDGVYMWNPDKLGWAHQQSLNKSERCLLDGQSVIIDNTNTRARERKPYIEIAAKCGSEVEIHCLPWKAEFISRNIHSTPKETVEKQLSRIDLDLGWIYDKDYNKLREIKEI